MTNSHVGLARRILRNAAALILVGVFAKGAGLVIAVLVARFLGPDAMGLFALLFSIAILLETFISVGMSDSLVRDAAAHPDQAPNLYLSALKLVTKISLVPAIVLALAAVFIADEGATRASLIVIAISTPVSGAFVVSQAVLQGTERVLLLTRVTFLSRILSLVLLAYALYQGAGIEAAFASRLLFQAVSLAVFFLVLWRGRKGSGGDYTARTLLTRSAPFALNLAIREIGVRLSSFLLPGAIGLGAAGVFDSANRIRSTLGMTMSASIVGLMPSFARNLGQSGSRSDGLVAYSMKYMCLAMSAVATVIALFSGWIIELLFGPAFAAASRPLQILVWAQVLIAVDAILQQAMLATGAEYRAIRHSTVGVLSQMVLILLLATALNLPGVALAILVTSALTLALDLRFVVRNVAAFSIRRFAAAPLAAASLVAGLMLVVDDYPFVVRLLVAIGSWAAAMILFRVLPRDELRFMMQLVTSGRAKQPGNT
jgi:O-antigen/teichoic acid export membrane protein